MDKKKTETMPCKNCKQMPSEHQYGPYDDLLCNVDLLPLQVQEMYYQPAKQDESMKSLIIYYPMDSLEYLEWEYERTQKDIPTRDNLT